MTGPTPQLDRRALERLAVGAPGPAPAAAPTPAPRAIERGARVRRGWPFRAYSAASRTSADNPARPAPRIAIGKPLSRARPEHDLSYEPLYLLVAADSARRSGSAAALAVQAAERFSGGRDVVLIDLDPEDSHLRDRWGGGAKEGIAEALEFGINLSAVEQRGEGGPGFVPIGTPPPDAARLFGHPGWERIVARARRDNVRLLAYLPAVPAWVADLGRCAGACLLLASPEDEQRLRATLPPDTPVVGVLSPTSDSAEPGNDDGTSTADARLDLSRDARSAPSGPGDSPARVALDSDFQTRDFQARDDPDAARPDERAVAASDLERALAGAIHSRTAAEETVRTAAPERTAEAEQPAEPMHSARPVHAGEAGRAGEAARAGEPVDSGEPERKSGPDDAPDLRRYIVPRTSASAERALRVAAVLILAYWTYYIVWRWTDTLNVEALWFSVPLALAETWGWLSAALLLFTVWRLEHRAPPPAEPGQSVDVLITTFDEPLTIIRRTAIGAREIRYPHRTYILDDARRDEVRAMAAEVGVGYITRPDNQHAKAGNLNHALGITSGDFILQLDADHAPLPTFLDRVLGFFDDPRVAFVQTPQDFYNLDSFTADVDDRSRRLWEDQKLFFSVIQPGKDRWNSAFFCGSCAAFRRTALDDIGGFSDQTITEDIETSIRLHGRGWKSVYYGESLAYGLAAHSATAFHIQHRRWARGAMQVFRKFNPLTHGKLTIAQRASYFYSLSAYWIGLQKLIFYLAPILFFATGVLPIEALDSGFLARFIPYFVLSIVFVELLARGLGFTLIAERYHMAKFWTYTLALPAYLSNRRLTFQVTPKGPGNVAVTTYAPQLLLMLVSVAAVYWATLAYSLGWVDYGVPGWRSLAFQLNFLWAGINFALAASVVLLSVRLKQRRGDYRFIVRCPITVRTRRPQSAVYDETPAESRNLNSSGIAFRSSIRFEPGRLVSVDLPLADRRITANATIVHVRTTERDSGATGFIHGAKFTGLDLPTRDAIELHCAQQAAGAENLRYRTTRQLGLQLTSARAENQASTGRAPSSAP